MMDDEQYEPDPADYPTGWDNTELEHFEVAHMACRAAWLWPEDDARRAIALAASYQCGVDYIERVAQVCTDTGADLDTARRAIAEAFRHRADELHLEREQNRGPQWV